MPLRQLNFEGEGRAITSAMCLGEVEVMDMIRLYFIILSYIMVLCFFFVPLESQIWDAGMVCLWY